MWLDEGASGLGPSSSTYKRTSEDDVVSILYCIVLLY